MNCLSKSISMDTSKIGVALWRKFYPARKWVSEPLAEDALVFLRESIISVLLDFPDSWVEVKHLVEMAKDSDALNWEKISEVVGIRSDWKAALESKRSGKELAAMIDGLTTRDLGALVECYQNGIEQSKVEEVLTECRFGWVIELLKAGNFEYFTED